MIRLAPPGGNGVAIDTHKLGVLLRFPRTAREKRPQPLDFNHPARDIR
jgi:hypothetical protein